MSAVCSPVNPKFVTVVNINIGINEINHAVYTFTSPKSSPFSPNELPLLQNSFGRPDDIVAAETLANHMRCNDSFVHAVFQAQFRSSLTCPRCKRQSNTFDPFLCVSVPVPQDQYKAVIVTVLYTSQQPRQVSTDLQSLLKYKSSL